MRRATAVMGALALVLSTVSVFAQAKTSFAGKWVLVPPPDAAAGGGGGGGRGGGRGGAIGAEATITQDEKQIVITRMAGDQTITTTYNLDGSDSKNTMMGRQGGAPTEQISKVSWDGAKMVVKTTVANGERTQVWSLEGGNLVIATTNPGREGGTPTTTTATYKKG